MKLSWKKLFLSTQFLTNFGRLHVELKKKVRVIRVTRIDSPSIYAGGCVTVKVSGHVIDRLTENCEKCDKRRDRSHWCLSLWS